MLAVFELVGKKFYSVQINTAVTDFSANSHRFVSVGILEFDFDVASYRQVGGSEETEPTFAEVDAAGIHDRAFVGMIDLGSIDYDAH